MDIITQRFIAIGNKLITELRRLSDSIQQQVNTTRDAKPANQEQTQTPPPISVVQPITVKKDAYESEQDNKRHWQTFGVQIALTVFTALAFGAAAYYACYAKKQWKQMTESNRLTRQSIEASQRPWLGRDGKPEVVLQILPDSMVTGTVGVPIKNFGPSPALRVGLGAYPWIRIGGDSNKAREEACKLADAWVREVSESVFPQQTKKLSTPVTSQVNGVEKAPMVLISGCIAYRDQFDTTKTTHHTTFCVFGSFSNLESLSSCGFDEIAD
jgi:hypothetical protein